MTWSICIRDPATGALAVAVTTRAFAVGARCPFVRAGVGAIASQASANTALGPMALDLMERGFSPEEAIRSVLALDRGANIRQIHGVDVKGRSFAWTGGNCVDWAGHLTAENLSAAGNMLANGNVVPASFARMAAGGAEKLAERLIGALDAGQAAGGDRRGKQSAALVIATDDDFPDINLRVDDHPEPLAELRRLLAVYRRDLEPAQHIFPRRGRFDGETDLDKIEALWKARGLEIRFRR